MADGTVDDPGLMVVRCYPRPVLHRALLPVLLVSLVACAAEDDGPAEGTDGTTGDSTSGSTGSTGSTGDASCDDPTQSLGQRLLDCEFDAELAEWAWVREVPASWELVPGALRIESLPGTLWEGANDLSNVALRPVPAQATVQVSLQAVIEEGGEQSGLLWYGDDDNYIKLVKEVVVAQTDVILLTESAGKTTVEAIVTFDGDAIDLRIQVDAGTLTASYRPTGADMWTELAQTSADVGAAPRLGLFSQGAPAGADRWSTFSGLHLE